MKKQTRMSQSGIYTYRPPRDVNENYQQFTEEFTRQLAKFQKSKGEVIIAGDYNIDLLKINNKPKITEYFDSILEHSFSRRSDSLLDSLNTEVH